MKGLMQSYPLTLTHVFQRAERLFPEKGIATVTVGGIERRTYGEWAQRVRRLAGVLDALGISEDGRVGTFAWNTGRHLELYFAAPCSGRVLHTLNIRLFPDDVVYIANHAEDEVVFVDRSLLKLFWPLVDRLETVKHVVVMDDGADEEIPDDPRVHDYEALLAESEPVTFATIDDENRAAAMCYTSGTTGHPKGVVYSHRSTVLHSMGALVAGRRRGVRARRRDAGRADVPRQRLGALPGGGDGRRVDGAAGPNMQPKALAELMESEKVTLAAGVPTIWMGVLPELEGRDLSSLRDIVCGGSAVPRSLSEAFREKIGLPILQAWGMTETSPVATTGRIKSTLLDASEDDLADLRAAQGLAIPLVDLRIVEPGTDDELPWDGEARGELQARGPWIAAGYYNDERSADSFTDDGWLRTGDVATISPNGYVRLVDRTKDLVKSGGEWISSVELENAIMAHPKVAEAAVIGIPDEKWSERPLACVVPDGDEEIGLDELQGVPGRARAEVVDPERHRDHRRGAEDVGRQVLQEDAARAVRGAQDDRLVGFVLFVAWRAVRLAARERALGGLRLLGRGAVEHQDAVEVVDLVLEDAGAHALGLDRHRLAPEVLGLDGDLGRALDLDQHARLAERETALEAGLGLLAPVRDDGVDDDRSAVPRRAGRRRCAAARRPGSRRARRRRRRTSPASARRPARPARCRSPRPRAPSRAAPGRPTGR